MVDFSVYNVPPRAWQDETCFVLGGGPSLTFGPLPTEKNGRIIAVNDAFLLSPYADILYFGDKQWFDDNIQDIRRYEGRNNQNRRILTRVLIKDRWRDATIKHMPFNRIGRDIAVSLSRHGSALSGWCSGSNAINLAFLHGVKRIVLLGFDMNGENWHQRHSRPKEEGCYKNFMSYIDRMAIELEKEKVEVINCSMESALTCFKKQPIEEILNGPVCPNCKSTNVISKPARCLACGFAA